MSRVLPIIFNTEMVMEILYGQKTVTRRAIPERLLDKYYDYDEHCNCVIAPDISCTRIYEKEFFMNHARYQTGDILYVRETYCPDYFEYEHQFGNRHGYKADYKKAIMTSNIQEPKWIPSIHMPKQAARIWLKITDVRVERLQDIMKDPPGPKNQVVKEGCKYGCDFIAVWENIIKKSEKDIYGWDANPWVWVIEFEKCENPEKEE